MSQLWLSEIEESLSKMEPKLRWKLYMGWVRSFESFWHDAVTHMAAAKGISEEKTKKHHDAISTAFDKMDEWYLEETPVVMARRNEIDSAISFISNAALEKKIGAYPGAACARSLAGVLRTSLYRSTEDYSPDTYASSMARRLYAMAAVRAMLQVDLSDFAHYLRKGENISGGKIDGAPTEFDINLLQKITARGCLDLGIPDAYYAVQKELEYIWKNFSQPKDWKQPTGIWRTQKVSLLRRVRQKSYDIFHNK